MADCDEGWHTVSSKKGPSEEEGPTFNVMLKSVKKLVPEGTYLTYNGVTYRCVKHRIEFLTERYGWVSNITRSYWKLRAPEEDKFEFIKKLITGNLKISEKKINFSSKSTIPKSFAEPKPVEANAEPTWNFEKNPPVYQRVIPSPPPPVKEVEILEIKNQEISFRISKCVSTLQRKDIGRRFRDEQEFKLNMFRRWEKENRKALRKIRHEDLLGNVIDSFKMLTQSLNWDLCEETLNDPEFIEEANTSLCVIDGYVDEINSGKKFDTASCNKQDYRVIRNIRALMKITTDFKEKYGF